MVQWHSITQSVFAIFYAKFSRLVWKKEFQLTQILGLLVMYFDAVVVFVTKFCKEETFRKQIYLKSEIQAKKRQLLQFSKTFWNLFVFVMFLMI